MTGRSPANLAFGHIGEDAAASANEGVSANLHAGTNEAVGGNPDAIADRDRINNQAKSPVLGVVTAGAEIAFLRDNAVLADSDAIEAVKNHIISNPRIVSYFHFPGIGKPSCRSDGDAPTDASAKKFENKAAQEM